MRNSVFAILAAASAALCAIDAVAGQAPAGGVARRREIAVSLVGQGRPSFPLEEASVAKTIRYLTKGMDREIARKPDLVVLPESCDMLVGLKGADKAKWIRMRGTKIREAMQEYAARHGCYVAYAAHREREDDRFANSCTLIDRSGRIVAVYDKCFPMTTEMDSPEFPIVPGQGAVVADTDFGRLGFAICFDLNFPELMREYAAKKPDIIVFSSAFDGGHLQQTWARECQAYVVSATVGATIPGRIIDPAGGELRHESYYMPIFTEYVNTNFRVIHIDFNGEKFPAIADRYGRRVTIRNPGTVGTVTLLSNDPELPIDDVMKEFSLEPLDRYLDRARQVRREFLPADAERPAAEDAVLENARFRLVLSGDGCAKSLVLKSTGEEMLERGARIPFSTITQNRAYDNEFKLMYAAKPWTVPSVKIVRAGDELRIGYRDEFFTAVVKIETTDSYIGLKLLRFDYELEASGFKRRTEIDSFALAQLPVKRRERFGRTLNVMWDEKGCFALMAAKPETRIDAFDRESGGMTFFAGGEKSVGIEGIHAVLAAADAPDDFLGCVDAMERGYGLPLGVQSRRHPLCAASYLAMMHVTPKDIGEFIAIAKEGGFRTVMQFGDFNIWRTIGHFLPTDEYAEGMADYRRVSDAVRAAGLIPGLHFFCTKVSRNDPYLTGGHPDPRMNTVCEVVLAKPAGAADTTLHVQTRPALLRREKGRGLVQFGDELIMYGGFTEEPPYMLTNCVRGLWNSTAAEHPRNATGRHLDVDDWNLFIRCGDNGIVDEIADRLAAWIEAGGARFFYMDGAEDVPEPFWHHVPRVQWNLWKRLATPPLWSETALKSHFGWHMHARGNAFDVFKGELQRGAMRKYILRTARQDADDFSPINLGWLKMQPPVRPDPKRKKPKSDWLAVDAFWNGTTGVQPDTVEYVACKAAAWNSPIGFMIGLKPYRSHPRAADCLAAFKRWEDAKLDGRFSAAQREAFKDGAREWFLWPFASPDRPEPVEWRQVTKDSEWPANPVRAFSYTRGGKAGIVYWSIDNPETPEIVLPGIRTSSMRDKGLRFIEADISEDELVTAFRRR